MKPTPISIYIHWPFCLSLCPYCDFNSHVSSSIDHNTWLEAYKKELAHFSDRIAARPVRSIFFGGGTPSLMEPTTVLELISAISDIAIVDKHTEITLEANPTSYESEKFKEFKAAGINRVSIGVQSLRNERLKSLGRKHSSQNALEAIKSAAKLFDKYSFDLMYATQNQRLEEWQDELKEALEFAGGHISLYQLTIEKGTPFFKLYNEKKLILPSNDEAADMYEWTNEYLQQNQYKRYEISNYAISGHECLHNLCYWNYDEYIGIGPGAHSRLHNRSLSKIATARQAQGAYGAQNRSILNVCEDSSTGATPQLSAEVEFQKRSNKDGIVAVMMTHNPQTWLNKVNEFGHGIQTQSQLSKIEAIEEVLMMGTRLQAGIEEKKFQEITGANFLETLNIETIEQLKQQGLVTLEAGHIKLSKKGLLLHSYIVPRILL